MKPVSFHAGRELGARGPGHRYLCLSRVARLHDSMPCPGRKDSCQKIGNRRNFFHLGSFLGAWFQLLPFGGVRQPRDRRAQDFHARLHSGCGLGGHRHYSRILALRRRHEQIGTLYLGSGQVDQTVQGDPLRLLVLYGVMTVVFSAVLNNVTAMIIVGSLTGVSLKKLNRSEKLLGFLLVEGLLTNIGGLAHADLFGSQYYRRENRRH